MYTHRGMVDPVPTYITRIDPSGFNVACTVSDRYLPLSEAFRLVKLQPHNMRDMLKEPTFPIGLKYTWQVWLDKQTEQAERRAQRQLRECSICHGHFPFHAAPRQPDGSRRCSRCTRPPPPPPQPPPPSSPESGDPAAVAARPFKKGRFNTTLQSLVIDLD